MSIRNFVEMTPDEQWRTVVEFADALEQEHGSFVVSDLVNGLGINKKMALKYMRDLEDTGEWVMYLSAKR